MIEVASQTEIVRMMRARKNEALLKIGEKHDWRWYNSKFPTTENGGCFSGGTPETDKALVACEKAMAAAEKAYVASLAKSGYVDARVNKQGFYRPTVDYYSTGGRTVSEINKESQEKRKALLQADVDKVEAAFRDAEENLMLMGSKEFADAFKAFVAELAKIAK